MKRFKISFKGALGEGSRRDGAVFLARWGCLPVFPAWSQTVWVKPKLYQLLRSDPRDLAMLCLGLLICKMGAVTVAVSQAGEDHRRDRQSAVGGA